MALTFKYRPLMEFYPAATCVQCLSALTVILWT